MKIDTVLPVTLPTASRQSVTELLPVGRILDAVVLTRQGNPLIELLAGKLRLTTEKHPALEGKSRVQLEVIGRTENGQPLLKPLISSGHAAQPLLLARLPQQIPINRLLSVLLPQAEKIPPSLQTALRDLTASLPQASDLTKPAGLQAALARSGLFTEALMAQGQAPLPDDFKVALLRLIQKFRGQTQADGGNSARTAGANLSPPAPTASAYSAKPAVAVSIADNSVAKPSPKATVDSAQRLANALANRALSPAPSREFNYVRIATTAPLAPSAADLSRADLRTNLQQKLLSSGAATATSKGPPLPGELQGIGRPSAEPVSFAVDSSNTNSLSKLLQLSEAGLARLESHQLQQVQSRDSTHPHWMFELPVVDEDGIDLWQLRFGREDSKNRSKELADFRWTVSLSFDFPDTGVVQADLALQGQRLSIDFYSEQSPTRNRIEQMRTSLKQRLAENSEFKIHIRSHSGSAPTKATGAAMLREKA